MSTSRIYITGRQSVEIEVEEMQRIKNEQFRDARVHIRYLFAAIGNALVIFKKYMEHVVWVGLFVALYFMLADEQALAGAVGEFRKASAVAIAEAIRGMLYACFSISLVTLAIEYMFKPSNFKFQDVITDDFYDRVAKKIGVKATEIECIN
jgi:hypothetical protein